MKNIKRILVVCHGNIHRSPIAEICIRNELKKRKLEKTIKCVSRGIQGSDGLPKPKFPNFTDYEAQYSLAKQLLNKLKIDIGSHVSKALDSKIVSNSDLIIAMDNDTLNGEHGLKKQFPAEINKMHLFSSLYSDKNEDIDDPFNITDKDILNNTIIEIYDGVQKAFPNLLKIIFAT